MLVYKATCNINGKIYIGITSNTLEYRMNQHKQAAEERKTYHFYNAIRKYGFDNFVFQVIEDGIEDYNELNQREKYWIEYYNSYEEGYNSTRGGDGRTQRDDELILKLFVEGKTTKEICQITGYTRNTIYHAFKNLDITEENNQRKNDAIRQRCGMPVLQYDLMGNFIKEWPSASSVIEQGYSQAMVSNVCRQKQLTAHGYLWKYKNDDESIEEWVKLNNNRKQAGKPKKSILQFDEQHNLIMEYKSAAEAAKSIGLTDKSCLCSAARRKGKSHGYYWEYKN